MRYKKVKLSILFLLSLGITELPAQEAIVSSGGNATGSGGTVSYTIGETVYTINAGTTGSVVQGVQQPFEISVVTGFEKAIGIELVSSVFPNPLNEFLTLKVENQAKENLSYQLYDMNGKLLGSKKITSNETVISMTDFASAVYFLKITRMQDNASQKEIKTFKIIKN